MKFGKTYKQRLKSYEDRKAAAIAGTNKRRVFAFWPTYCNNTGRTVWLEFVICFEEWDCYNSHLRKRTYEIEKSV